VKIIRINAEIQSSAARIIYHISGANFRIIDDINGVIMAANSQ
jgi:hypothetical protein